MQRKRWKYKCKVTFNYGNNIANAKSVLSVLGACIKSGDEITLVCEGVEMTVSALVAFIESGVGE